MTKIIFKRGVVLSSLLLIGFSSIGQTTWDRKSMRWQHLDLQNDSVYGVSMDRAYQSLLKTKERKVVIVAVIDSGTDTLNQDIKPVLWNNIVEKGADEDRNGYLGDRHGWNFLGEKSKNRTLNPGFEYYRIYLSLKGKCGGYSEAEILQSGNKDCAEWLSTRERFKADSTDIISSNLMFWQAVDKEDSIWRILLRKDVYKAKDIEAFVKKNGKGSLKHVTVALRNDTMITNQQFLLRIDEAKIRLFKKFSDDPAVHRLETIGDNYNNFEDRFYGNRYVTNLGDHGTDVASVIGAIKNNEIGIDGLAEEVRIMAIRAVPREGDEYDKDVAHAIRYAVDNGAKVINMSFGKLYSPQRKWVEEAIRYAEERDVLLIHAAGNDAINIDSITHYPTSEYLNGMRAKNMITVGASGPSRSNIVGAFSNYGQKSVDVFAPGVQVCTAVYKDNKFEYKGVSGTSIAAPVVSAIAAMLRSYYPKLTAAQVKFIIEASATKISGYVKRPGSLKQVRMTELCKSGGIVNAYEAVKLANKLSKKSKR